MCAGIRFPQHDGNDGNSGIRPGEQQLGAVTQDTFPILFRTDHVTGTIPEGHYRNIEKVAEPDESGSFVCGIDGDHAGSLHRLVGKDPDGAAVEAAKTGDNAGGMQGHGLKENAVIDDCFNYFLHVIRRGRFVRDNCIEFRTQPFRIVFGRQHWCFLGIVRRQ